MLQNEMRAQTFARHILQLRESPHTLLDTDMHFKGQKEELLPATAHCDLVMITVQVDHNEPKHASDRISGLHAHK